MLEETLLPFIIPTFNLNELKDEYWELIGIHKFKYTLPQNFIDMSGIMFPGFKFSSKEAAKFYDETVLDFVVNELKAFTTPRGNLSKENNIIMIGQRPGHFGAHLSKAESAWLLGPSSKMLVNLCKELKIYPYFTNFYHSHYVDPDRAWYNIYKELVGIFTLYKNFYNKSDFRIVFLGNYSEYDELKIELEKLTDLKLQFIKIWHPAYLLRNSNPNLFSQWVTSLGRQLVKEEIPGYYLDHKFKGKYKYDKII